MITNRTPRRLLLALTFAVTLGGCATATGPRPATPRDLDALALQVEIRRTEHGVPHIIAENLRAAAFALAYVQIEDHGPRIIEGMNAARGQSALVAGPSRANADASAKRRYARAIETWPLLRQDTREVYEGFAAGMNQYIRVNGANLPSWMRPDFTGHDIFVRDITGTNDQAMNRFRQQLLEDPLNARVVTASAYDAQAPAWSDVDEDDASQNVGSNAWALTPSRTATGNAILLRNPHLSWDAGYYEAHVRVPGELDFYGDFRIGGPFTVIGGFNRDLGFATTNNAARSHEFYAFRVDPARADHYLLDGQSHPLLREVVTVEYRDGDHVGTESREFLDTHLGPVVHRDSRYVYILRAAAAGDFRAGEQWLAMMKASSLDEWKAAMRIEARTTSNFTYADRAGNVFYVWVSGAPKLPHAPGGDTLAILASTTADVWTQRMPFDSLPHLLNPPGGYIRNENDSPHYTNMNAVMPHTFNFPVEDQRLRLRSQHGLELLHNDRVFTLEDVVVTKHSPRMLLADRVKDDLIAAVRAASADGVANSNGNANGSSNGATNGASDAVVLEAIALLERWNNTAAADARGAVLFETWWNRYRQLMRGEDLHAVEWAADEPVTTPRGLADLGRAVEAFAPAIAETAERFGSWDVAWGEVHRVRRGNVDVPVSGCGGALGCFRVLNFTTADDGKRFVNGGDGWVIAVEFGDQPRAYSVLAYGQSPDPASPYHANQAAMFAAGQMKATYWSEQDIERATVRRYRPGAEQR